MNDEALEAALYASRRSKRGHRRIEEPDWADVHRGLKRKHVTLLILWDEYAHGVCVHRPAVRDSGECGYFPLHQLLSVIGGYFQSFLH